MKFRPVDEDSAMNSIYDYVHGLPEGGSFSIRLHGSIITLVLASIIILAEAAMYGFLIAPEHPFDIPEKFSAICAHGIVVYPTYRVIVAGMSVSFSFESDGVFFTSPSRFTIIGICKYFDPFL